MRGTGVRELTFRIVLQDPPAGVDFGLQIGRGAECETVQTQRSKGKDLSFEFSIGAVAAGSKTSVPPDFHGPVVQGRPSQRFIDIDIGTYAGQRNTPWSRRLNHVAERGCDLFRAACDRDLEGIVAKWAHGTYQTDTRSTSWLKIKNAHYSQMEGRRELFESRRDGARSTFRAKPPLELRLA